MPLSPAGVPSAAHTADPGQTRDELRKLRPELVAAYDRELPGARAAILSRLLGALDREPLPGVTTGRPGEVILDDRRVVRFPAGAARPFAPGQPGLSADLAGVTLDEPGTLVRALWGDVPLAQEIDNSVANLALARANQDGDPGTDDGDLARTEQSIVDGHPLHPCCRTRGGMSVEDVLAYAPEHRPVIRLRRLRVPADRWYGTAPPILLAHPWQAARLRESHPWLVDDGETAPARPLMSLRTVAPLDGGLHVKTAVDVQMTSAVRTVSPAAVHNGPRLSALLTKLTADLPLDVLTETTAGAVIVDGRPRRHLAHLVREAPRLSHGETAFPLAKIPTKEDINPYDFTRQIGKILFAPLLTILNRGVALEAHGQNTILVLKNGHPHRILYRDLGGVRVSPHRLHAIGVEAPPLHGDLPTDDPDALRTKLAAAAFGTVAAELIAGFTRRGADPDRLWRIVATALGDSPDAHRLRTDPLPLKATTAMRLAADPLRDIWTHLPNPMAAHA